MSRSLAPSTNREWIENQQQLTREIGEFRRVGGGFDFSGLLDVTKPVEKSRIAGAALETTDIRDVVLVVDRAAEWREIALNPPAAMKFEWKAVAKPFGANRRLHRLPASVPKQNPSRRHARRQSFA